MATQSNVCTCAVCNGSECKCGCQTTSSRPAASCQCGPACSCGDTCSCGAGAGAQAGQPHSPSSRVPA
jgi:hypothetical protein